MRTDEQLVARMRYGDAQALRVLYRRYHRLVFWVARKHLRIREDCEEVVQDVFCQMWYQADRYDALRATVKRWMLSIAYARALDKLRSTVGDARCGVTHTEVPLFEADQPVERDPLDKLLADEMLRMLDNARQRMVVRLRINGWDIHEVARVLNETVGNGKHHYVRGICRMRELVEAK